MFYVNYCWITFFLRFCNSVDHDLNLKKKEEQNVCFHVDNMTLFTVAVIIPREHQFVCEGWWYDTAGILEIKAAVIMHG